MENGRSSQVFVITAKALRDLLVSAVPARIRETSADEIIITALVGSGTWRDIESRRARREAAEAVLAAAEIEAIAARGGIPLPCDSDDGVLFAEDHAVAPSHHDYESTVPSTDEGTPISTSEGSAVPFIGEIDSERPEEKSDDNHDQKNKNQQNFKNNDSDYRSTPGEVLRYCAASANGKYNRRSSRGTGRVRIKGGELIVNSSLHDRVRVLAGEPHFYWSDTARQGFYRRIVAEAEREGYSLELSGDRTVFIDPGKPTPLLAAIARNAAAGGLGVREELCEERDEIDEHNLIADWSEHFAPHRGTISGGWREFGHRVSMKIRRFFGLPNSRPPRC